MTKVKFKIIKTPDQYATMTTKEIIDLIFGPGNYAVRGEVIGVDRHIVEFSSLEDLYNYDNPYTKQ